MKKRKTKEKHLYKPLSIQRLRCLATEKKHFFSLKKKTNKQTKRSDSEGLLRIRSDLDRFRPFWQYLARSGRLLTMAEFRPVSAKILSTGIRRRWQDVAGFRWPDVAGFRQLTIAGFRQSDIKHACKDQEFNFGKRFTVFKTVNRFLKIKEAFMVKPKMIFVDHYFRPYQTQ
jgi:hypothetical protein